MNKIFIIAIIVLSLSGYGYADEYVGSSRSLALSQSMTASASGTGAIWNNPAGITSLLMYSTEAGYGYNREKNSHGLMVNLLDTKSNPYFGSALSLVYDNGEKKGIKQHDLQIKSGFSIPLADRLLHLGLSGTYTYRKVINKDKAVVGAGKVNRFSLDLGVLIHPLEWLYVGFAAQNLINGSYNTVLPLTLATGIALSSLQYGINVMFDMKFNMDAKRVKDSGIYGGGVEYLFAHFFPIRLGYQYEQYNGQSSLSAGLAYRDKKGILGIDVSYQHKFESRKDGVDFSSNDRIFSSLSLYF